MTLGDFMVEFSKIMIDNQRRNYILKSNPLAIKNHLKKEQHRIRRQLKQTDKLLNK